MAKFEKNDFIEVDFIGKDKEGQIFDTTLKDEAKKIGLEIEAKPIVICLGQSMILPAIDEFLIGKEIGNYTLELKPEKAFGERKKEMIKIMPISAFKNANTPIQRGVVFSFDGILGKVSAVSGGRVIVDFNNPVAGKEIVYELKVKREIENIEDKIKALMNFFFRREFKFKIEEKKLTIEAEKNLMKIIEMFKEKFGEILSLELEVKEVEAKTAEREETKKPGKVEIEEKTEKVEKKES